MTNGRTELQTVLDFIRRGDVLMVTRIDRLARSIGDLRDIGGFRIYGEKRPKWRQ